MESMKYAVMHPKELWMEDQKGNVEYRNHDKDAYYGGHKVIVNYGVPQNIKVIIIPEVMRRIYER